MIPVFQDKFGKDGNCFNACVASVLEIPLCEADDVKPLGPGVWYRNWQAWFEARGYSLECVSKLYPPKGFSIVSVSTERCHGDGTQITHACVALDGVIVHDPYPGGSDVDQILHYHEIEKVRGDGVS